MSKKIIIDANFPNEIRVALLNSHNHIEDIEYETSSKQQLKGNIYLAKIVRVEPSLQAAFIDYGNDKSGFLPFGEIHPMYFHIPVSDQKSSMGLLKSITPPNITSDDLAEAEPSITAKNIMDNEDLDLSAIEQLIDEKVQSDFDPNASEVDIETIGTGKHDLTAQQKQYKIQEVIKKGQVLLVQVSKEERGNKGASFTTYISLAGKYCVLMPNKPSQNGVSRKISNAEERKRLKNIISKLGSEIEDSSTSIIARTAAIGHTTLEIKRDYDYLARLWNKIREATLQSTAPCFIHQEDGIIQKTIRDMFDHNVKELIVQGGDAFQSAVKFMKDILPLELNKVKEYKQQTPIFTKFNIEDQLSSLYQPIVPLPSGGYIVINPTEALISIDVNSGKATSERNIEETALKTNLEASKEIARQTRLRELSGLIVIDFIDMNEARNRKIIERSVREFFARDRARIQTNNISPFGLLEMSRQRMRPSFLESNSSICSHCNGKGIVRANESNAMLILRTVENEIFNDKVDVVNVYASMSSVIYLLNNKRQEIGFIEGKYNIKLNFNFDPNATSDSYAVEKIKLPKNSSNTILPATYALQGTSDIYQAEPVVKSKKKWTISEEPAVKKQNEKPVNKNSEKNKEKPKKEEPEQAVELIQPAINNETEVSQGNEATSYPSAVVDSDDGGASTTSVRRRISRSRQVRRRNNNTKTKAVQPEEQAD